MNEPRVMLHDVHIASPPNRVYRTVASSSPNRFHSVHSAGGSGRNNVLRRDAGLPRRGAIDTRSDK